MFDYIGKIFWNETIRKKILFTLFMLAVYRLLVFIPVPFVDINALNAATFEWGQWLQYFAMLLWWSLEQFSIIGIWLAPYINASIIMQLMATVIPKLEELQELWETGQKKIQQYTRYLTLTLAFIQWIWMVFFVNYLLGGGVIDTSNILVVLWTAAVFAVWAMMIMWLWELITEKGISNGISLLIFASIISGITSQVYSSMTASGNLPAVIIFMLVVVLVLVVISIFLIRTLKELPVIYARQWKIEQTSILPFPLNPVGMIPIIFAIAFASFPYLLSQLITRFGSQKERIQNMAQWIELNFNIYDQNPGWWIIIIYFFLIVFFTFFYAMVQFNPDRIADNIQKRWGFISGIRPGKETATYINKVLQHLCLWGGIWLAILGIYSYLLYKIPVIQNMVLALWSIPVVVTGSWVIIIVWVVQELINKIKSELVMAKYEE